MTIEHILGRTDCPYAREELSALGERLTVYLPFNNQMTTLLAGLDRAPHLNAREVLRKTGLWQRLTFQYRYQDELPHRDVQERTHPAASHVGYEVTLDTLRGWLSEPRLVKRLERFCRETIGGDTDD